MAKSGCYRRDQLNFNAGELSPLLHYRVDLEPVSRGARQMQNAIPRKYGNVERRIGTRYVEIVKDGGPTKVRGLPFNFSVYDTISIEMGHLYFRFFRDGVAIGTSQYSPYEVTHPYTEDELFEVNVWQLNDVMFFAHPNHPPYRLMRYTDLNWVMQEVPFNEPVFLDQNTSSTTITPSGTTGNISMSSSTGVFNSAMVGGYIKLGHRRTSSSVSLELTETANSSTLAVKGKFTLRTSGTWSGTILLQREDSGIWNTVYTFASDKDQNFNQQLEQSDDNTNNWRISFTFVSKDSVSPKAYLESEESYVYGWAKITSYNSPTTVEATVEEAFQSATATDIWMEGAWSPYRGYPSAVAYYQDRMMYAGTSYQPQTIWASVSGDYYNFEGITGVTSIQDDYAVAKTMGSAERIYIRWLYPLGQSMIAGTSAGDFSISGSNGGDDPITATNFTIKPQTHTGDSSITPVGIGNALLHLQRDGKKVYEMTYSISSYGYEDADITQFAEHITGDGITGFAYQRQPDSILWCVRKDGVLLACVYDQSQKVCAWSRFVTQGAVESVWVVYGPIGDEVWMIVKRTLGDGFERRFIERIYPEAWSEKSNCWYVDSALGYTADTLPVTPLGWVEKTFYGCSTNVGIISIPARNCFFSFVTLADSPEVYYYAKSIDGINWTTGSNVGYNVSCGAWSNTLGVLVTDGDKGYINRSTDLETFTQVALNYEVSANVVCWANGRSEFCIGCSIGAGDSPVTNIMTSPDGITWTARGEPFLGEGGLFGLCYSDSLGLYCLTRETNSGNGIFTSPDAVTWTNRVSTRSLGKAIFSSIFNKFFVISTFGSVFSSADGITWVETVIWEGEGLFDICDAPSLGRLFVSTGDSESGMQFASTADGINWELQDGGSVDVFGGMAWSEELGMFCVCGNQYNMSGYNGLISIDGGLTPLE